MSGRVGRRIWRLAMDRRETRADGLEDLIAGLWGRGEAGRAKVRGLLLAIEAAAPAAIDQAHARRVGRQLEQLRMGER